MADFGDAVQGIWNLLEMVGAALKWIFRPNRSKSYTLILNDGGNGLLGLFVVVMIIFIIGLGACTSTGSERSNSTEPSDQVLNIDDDAIGSKSIVLPAFAECAPRSMRGFETLSPLALQIVSGQEFSLANDTLALPLLDSMLNGSNAETRRLYFLIVTRSLRRSDGYYSEGAASWGTQYLFGSPGEFLSSWSECLAPEEQKEWAWYLAAEERIGSEGYPVDEVLHGYRLRLDSVIRRIPERYHPAGERLYLEIDSIYRGMTERDALVDPVENK